MEPADLLPTLAKRPTPRSDTGLSPTRSRYRRAGDGRRPTAPRAAAGFDILAQVAAEPAWRRAPGSARPTARRAAEPADYRAVVRDVARRTAESPAVIRRPQLPASRDVPRRVRASAPVAARSPRRRRSHATRTSGCRRIPASAAELPKPVPCRYLRSPRPPPVLLAASHRQPYGQSYVPPAVGLDRNLTQGELPGGWGRTQQCPRNRGLGLRLSSAASHPDRCQH